MARASSTARQGLAVLAFSAAAALVVACCFFAVTADSTGLPWIPDDGQLEANDIPVTPNGSSANATGDGASNTTFDGASEPDDKDTSSGSRATAVPSERLTFDAEALASLPWNLRLVNRDYPLAYDVSPQAFAMLPSGTWADGSQYVDARIADDLAAMLQAAQAAGVSPKVISSYRSYSYQKDLFANRVARAQAEDGLTGDAAVEAAAFWVALPGASEHQMGLALDIVDAGYTTLDKGQESTATQQWLMEHCADYGFILRYPTDKSAITGIGYEPWHYRYVGREAAQAIMASGLCFEEWLARELN